MEYSKDPHRAVEYLQCSGHWNSDITNESWKELLVLSTKYNFILIGGWAIYLYIKLQKSRDIDMVVDYDQFKLFIKSSGGTVSFE